MLALQQPDVSRQRRTITGPEKIAPLVHGFSYIRIHPRYREISNFGVAGDDINAKDILIRTFTCPSDVVHVVKHTAHPPWGSFEVMFKVSLVIHQLLEAIVTLFEIG